MLRITHCLDSRLIDGVEVVSLTCRPSLYYLETLFFAFSTHFLLLLLLLFIIIMVFKLLIASRKTRDELNVGSLPSFNLFLFILRAVSSRSRHTYAYTGHTYSGDVEATG
jgi:hypothetical protein